MKKYIRAVEFSNKRVGSTFFQHALNSHPDIEAIDEIMVNICRKASYRKSGFIPFIRPENPHKTPKGYLENYIYKTHANKNTIFKLKYNQIVFHSGLLQYIKDNNVSIINLQRKNIVKQIISGKKAAYQNHDPISITGQQLLNEVKEADRLNKYWSKELKNNIKLSLTYEEIIGNREGDRTYLEEEVNKKICDFFNVPYERLYSTTKKKNKRDISVYLPNIEEIKRVFNNTKYSWMLK